MDSPFEKSTAFLKDGNALLDSLDSSGCMSCKTLGELGRKISRLGLAMHNFKDILLRYDYGSDFDKPFGLDGLETTLMDLIKNADTVQKVLLEKCPDCANLPAAAKTLIMEYRQNVAEITK